MGFRGLGFGGFGPDLEVQKLPCLLYPDLELPMNCFVLVGFRDLGFRLQGLSFGPKPRKPRLYVLMTMVPTRMTTMAIIMMITALMMITLMRTVGSLS